MPKELEPLLAERSISTTSHRSNQLDPFTLNAAQLILTMEGRHVQEIAISFPDAFARTLPIMQAVPLIREGDSLEDFVERLQDRNTVDYLSSDWDVEDPYKRGKRKYKKMVATVDDLVERVIGPLHRSQRRATLASN